MQPTPPTSPTSPRFKPEKGTPIHEASIQFREHYNMGTDICQFPTGDKKKDPSFVKGLKPTYSVSSPSSMQNKTQETAKKNLPPSNGAPIVTSPPIVRTGSQEINGKPTLIHLKKGIEGPKGRKPPLRRASVSPAGKPPKPASNQTYASTPPEKTAKEEKTTPPPLKSALIKGDKPERPNKLRLRFKNSKSNSTLTFPGPLTPLDPKDFVTPRPGTPKGETTPDHPKKEDKPTPAPKKEKTPFYVLFFSRIRGFFMRLLRFFHLSH